MWVAIINWAFDTTRQMHLLAFFIPFYYCQTGYLLYVYITPVTRMGIPALPVYTCRDIRAGAGNIRAGAGKFAGMCRNWQEHAAGMENLENRNGSCERK